MATRAGYTFDLGLPDFRERNRAVPTWSSTITSATKPVVSNVVNSSSNLSLVGLEVRSGPLTAVGMTALHTVNHGTTRSRGFDTSHRGPCDISAGGYDWFERIFLGPTSASIKVLNSTNLSIRTLSTYRH